MLGYDLSNTPLARASRAVKVPTEGELLAIQVALMLVDDCAYGDLTCRRLVLTPRNRRQVAAVIRRRLTPLVRDFATPDLHARLDDLVGLTIIGPPASPHTAGEPDGCSQFQQH